MAVVAAVIGAAVACTTDLGGLGGELSRATDISADGEVVGYATAADGSGPFAVRFTGDGAQRLAVPEGTTASRAHSVNSTGYIAGTSVDARGANWPVVWLPNGDHWNLASRLSGLVTVVSGEANAVSDDGKVVGSFSYRKPDGTLASRAFLIDLESRNDHGTDERSNVAVHDIGPDGTIVGTVDGKPYRWMRFGAGYTSVPLWSDGQVGDAKGIDAAGNVYGHIDGRPAMWTKDIMSMPTFLPSPAQAGERVTVEGANASGMVVGTWHGGTADARWTKALRWRDVSTAPEVLAPLGDATVADAQSIDDAGEVVGSSAVGAEATPITATRWDAPGS